MSPPVVLVGDREALAEALRRHGADAGNAEKLSFGCGYRASHGPLGTIVKEAEGVNRPCLPEAFKAIEPTECSVVFEDRDAASKVDRIAAPGNIACTKVRYTKQVSPSPSRIQGGFERRPSVEGGLAFSPDVYWFPVSTPDECSSIGVVARAVDEVAFTGLIEGSVKFPDRTRAETTFQLDESRARFRGKEGAREGIPRLASIASPLRTPYTWGS